MWDEGGGGRVVVVSDKGSGLDGNGLLKASAFFMEDTMAAGAFGCARNYG